MRRPSMRLAIHVTGAAGLLAYAWWATGRRPFTLTVTVAVVGAGLAAMAMGQVRRPSSGSHQPLAGASGWVVLLAAVTVWQLLAYLQEPRSEHPTLSSLTNAALDTHATRSLAFAAWLVGAWQLARR